MASPSPHDSVVEAPARDLAAKADRSLSGADLIHDLIEPGQTIRVRDLVPLIERAEDAAERELLDAVGKNFIRGLAESGQGDLELGPEELSQMISLLPKPATDDETAVEASTAAARPSASKRISSSGRIRSQSDTDSTSASEDDASLRAGSPGSDDSPSGAARPDPRAGLARGISFPSSGTEADDPAYPPSAFPGGPRRATTTSDPARPHGIRPPPSSFGYAAQVGFGGGGGRPTPPALGKKKGRRGSDGGESMRSPMSESGRYGALQDGSGFDGTPRSRKSSGQSSTGAAPSGNAYATPTVTRPKPPRPSHRRRSSAYSAAGAGGGGVPQPWSPAAEGAFSPGVDGRSFVASSARDAMRSPDQFGLDADGDEDGRGQDARLMRLTTSSTTSLQLTHDQMIALERANAEYIRKNQELQRQLEAAGNDNEARIAELQDRLDEAKSDLAIKRKEEKDLRIKEKNMNIQLAALEADLQNLQRSLDMARSAQADLSKSYASQVGETDRLRKTILDREEELAAQKRTLDSYEIDKSDLNDNIQELEAQLRNMQESLQIAQQAEVELQRQKQENLNLKETISRLNYDIDEMRIQNAAGHSRQATSSLSGTVSKNLGDEIARSLKDAAAESAQHADGKSEETVRTVYKTVTIHTERVIQAEGSSEPARTVVEEVSTDYVDASVATELPDMISAAVQTDLSMAAMLPAYSPEPIPSAAEILRGAHPHLDGSSQNITLPSMADLQNDYATLSLGLGFRCHVLEEKLAKAQAETIRGGSLEKRARHATAATNSESAKLASEAATFLQVLLTTAAAPDRLWILPATFVAVGAVGYLLGHHAGTSPASAMNEILLMRDIKNIALGPPHYLSGTWVLKAIGGATHVVGRVPM